MASSYLKALCLGIVAGSRSMSAPALVSNHFARNPSPATAQSSFGWLASPTTAAILKALAVGELVGDKLPGTPSRLAPAPLMFRALSGGLSGAAVCAAEGEQAGLGALAGGVAALVSAFGCYHLRQYVDDQSKLPDPFVGAVEDGLVLSLGWKILKQEPI